MLKKQMQNLRRKRNKQKRQQAPTSMRLDFEPNGDGSSVDHSFSKRLATKSQKEEIQIYAEIRALVKDRYS